MCFSGRIAPEKRLFREIVMTYENPQYPQLSSKASGREEFHCGSDQASEAIASGFGSEAGEEDTCGEVSGGGPQRWHCGCSGASASRHDGRHANGTAVGLTEPACDTARQFEFERYMSGT